MLFRRFFSTRTRSIQLPSALSNGSAGNEPSASVHPEPPTMLQPSYPDYLNEHGGTGWDAALIMSSIIRDMPALPRALSGPLTQVFDVLAEVIEAVKIMHSGRDGCTQLIVRVTKFLESFVGGLKESNVLDNSAIASSLSILRRNLMAICADAKRWSSLNLLNRYIQRHRIMTAISRHEQNLTDCFHVFQIVVSITGSYPVDRPRTIASLDPSVSARPPSAPENALTSILLEGLHDFFDHPAGQAVFEQIGAAVRGRLEEMGLQATSTPLGSRDAGETGPRIRRDRHVSYLRSQISELMAEVRGVSPHISVGTDVEVQVVGSKTHKQPTGDLTRQLRKAVMATLELLNELHDVAEVKSDSAMLAGKMDDLAMNLHDLGLQGEAFEVQSMAAELYHAGGKKSDLSGSLV
ncbi:hypothetical protein BS47DRAFT_1392840 [Hydnum rufescens UP504]|uniref:Uncharacterized protein n=1 Tax=Hydnum rufescens UP504 TaxID=1448309 RepID=A0A9P6B053_9AGAM|nr:hypothetical protein BS47DRAFT_1392840 [Hydnum rufescens UP504]